MPLGAIGINGDDYEWLPMRWTPQGGPKMTTLETLPLGSFRVVVSEYGTTRRVRPQVYQVAWNVMDEAMGDALRLLYEAAATFTVEYTDVMGRTLTAAPTRDYDGAYTEFFAPTFPFKSGTVTVYKNGAAQGAGFSLQNARGSVVFDSPIDPADVVTVTYDWQLLCYLAEMTIEPRADAGEYSHVSCLLRETT